ncbi:MAG: hypothetical protein NTY08_19210 [Proteobacteria bacterium]|nr:hypothetical protein [Pseudomonadota bacterium]
MDALQKIYDDTISDIQSFFKNTGQIGRYEDLISLGLQPDMISGDFWLEKVNSLIEFCSANPEYHIISWKDRQIFNQFQPNARRYFLANGHADPNLMLDFQSRLSVEQILQVGQAKLASVFRHRKGGIDA